MCAGVGGLAHRFSEKGDSPPPSLFDGAIQIQNTKDTQIRLNTWMRRLGNILSAPAIPASSTPTVSVLAAKTQLQDESMFNRKPLQEFEQSRIWY